MVAHTHTSKHPDRTNKFSAEDTEAIKKANQATTIHSIK